MNTYSLNQEPVPQVQIGQESYDRRFVNISIVAVAVALIIGMLYWWTTMNSPAIVSTKDDVRAQIAEQLRQSQVEVTQAQVASVASQLSSSDLTPTQADRESVSRSLSEQ